MAEEDPTMKYMHYDIDNRLNDAEKRSSFFVAAIKGKVMNGKEARVCKEASDMIDELYKLGKELKGKEGSGNFGTVGKVVGKLDYALDNEIKDVKDEAKQKIVDAYKNNNDMKFLKIELHNIVEDFKYSLNKKAGLEFVQKIDKSKPMTV